MTRPFEVTFTRTRLPVSMIPWTLPAGLDSLKIKNAVSVTAVGAMLPAAIGGKFFGGPPADDFVEEGFLVARLPEDTPEPLDVLADRARTRQDDRHVRLGDVHAFVEDARGRHDRIRACVEM